MKLKNFARIIAETPPETRKKVVDFLDALDEEHIKTLIKKIDYETGGCSLMGHRLKHKDMKELLEFGDRLLKPMYDLIDDCTLTCLAIISVLHKFEPFKPESVGYDPKSGACHMKIRNMENDYKEWYELNYKTNTNDSNETN